jgi:glucose-1-phosphate cytidylyltransferase
VKVAILAGGAGTRLAEETDLRPKPMVEIGGMPILWRMIHYNAFGHREFAIALGYKGESIKRWFTLNGSMPLHVQTGGIKRYGSSAPAWSVDLVETEMSTLTGGRIKRLMSWMSGQPFMLTWGDGLSDVNLHKLLALHGKLATMTAVRPPARYGQIEFDGDRVVEFTEKPQTAEGWINGAIFVLEPGVEDYIDDEGVMFEHGPLQRLAADGQLTAYRHESFWQCVDTLREKHLLHKIWDSGQAPWKSWS